MSAAKALPIAVILIGRNEGARLVRALDAIRHNVAAIVYVDSGSTDASISEAQARGAAVVELDTSIPFTAARARNAGVAHLRDSGELPEFLQFIDGDCELRPDWLDRALAFLRADPDAAAVCGRRREKHPDASIYNWLTDQEWNTPVGRALATGGDVLMRTSAFEMVGGFRNDLIAGEEPELCVRLRMEGWTIWRMDAEMTLHDAELTRFGQWWQRTKRAGHAYAEGVALHGRPPERHKWHQLRSALAWGLGLPLVTLLACLIVGWPALLLLGLIPVQMFRLTFKGMDRRRAIFLTLAKWPEALGALSYAWRRLARSRMELIEYK